LEPQSENLHDQLEQPLGEPKKRSKTPEEEAKLLSKAEKTKSAEADRRTEEKAKMLAIKAGLGLPTALKHKFLEPFTNEEKKEFVRIFRESRDNPEAALLFEKNIGGNVNFVAYKGEARFGGGILFRVMDGEEIKAQITFDPETGNVLNMVHREVQSQSFGISGSSLLIKIDEYFKALEESKVLSPETTFSVEAGQASVAQWALKNGYAFKDREQEQLFHSIISGQKNDEYLITDVGDGKLFNSYFFRRDVYNLHKSDLDENPTLAKKYSVRFTLIKKLMPVAEEIKTVPQPGESTGKAPLVDGLNTVDFEEKKQQLNCKLSRSENLSLEEIFTSSAIDQASIPYYQDVYQDILKGDQDWAVTKKVKEYADYLAKNPGTLAILPPIQFLNNKLHDGAHRLSAIFLLSKLYPDSQWPKVKLKVDFYEGKVEK